jgi:hypothetical protein
MKHVGRMKNNGARVAIAYRTLPGDPYSALVIGTQGLGDSYHDTLMSLIESDAGQQTNELAEVLAVRRFPDGSVMLGYLHANGHLKKVPTANVLVTPDSQTQVPLNELNVIIAKQKGVDLEDLAVSDGSPKKPKTTKKVQVEESVTTTSDTKTTTFEMTPAEMRSRADALYKEAARLRKDADAMDPPKSKKKAVVEVE